MGVTLSVENVPEELAAKLQERARRFRRSLQGEILIILEKAAVEPVRLSLRDVFERVQAMGLRTPSESTALIRQDRDGR
jgi:plasmid stability protein